MKHFPPRKVAGCPCLRLLVVVLLASAGCATVPPREPLGDAEKTPAESGSVLLMPGDELEISFLGAPELNTSQRIRRDGRISLRILGEIQAAGKTAETLKEELIVGYAPQLQIQEATVIVRSAAQVFVSGAVLSPGKIEMQRPLTALEAIMEAGGFNTVEADVRKVVVIRHEGGNRKEFAVDLSPALSGKSSRPFPLKPNDIVHVPRKRQWL